MVRRIALGTAQFGLNYGVANCSGQVLLDEAAAIVEHARRAGVDLLDTAIAYGDSEARLGTIGIKTWNVVSKLPPHIDGRITSDWVTEALSGSLARLRLPKLYGLLLHRSDQLLGQDGPVLYRALARCRDEGRVQKIGVSIYAPEELDRLHPSYRFDLVQAPFNVVDRRLATSGWLSRLFDCGVEVHTRSAFLQGLLLVAPGHRPHRFARWQSLWDDWHNWLRVAGLSPLRACLSFVLSHPEVGRVIVGVDSLAHLHQVLASAGEPMVEAPAALTNHDLDLIDPSRWTSA